VYSAEAGGERERNVAFIIIIIIIISFSINAVSFFFLGVCGHAAVQRRGWGGA
jgi:hypothetical protein